jgi:hypothetical protein
MVAEREGQNSDSIPTPPQFCSQFTTVLSFFFGIHQLCETKSGGLVFTVTYFLAIEESGLRKIGLARINHPTCGHDQPTPKPVRR